MDERKRTFDQDDGSVGQQKRVRPEEILGALRDDTSLSILRVLLDKAQFARVIGRAGQTIAWIRATTGARVKGTDLTDTDRLVIVTGSTAEVAAAFEAMLGALFGNPDAISPVNYGEAHAAEDRVIVNLLVEHSKAGRLVGAKGINIHSLKQRSGALVRVEKEPLEFAGVLMRKVSLEGTMSAVGRAHCLIQELYSAGGAPSASPPGAECCRAGQRSCPPSPSLSSINSAHSLPLQVATPTHTVGGKGRGGGGGAGGAAFLAMSDAFGRSLPSDVEAGQSSSSSSSRSAGKAYIAQQASGSLHSPHPPNPSPNPSPNPGPNVMPYPYPQSAQNGSGQVPPQYPNPSAQQWRSQTYPQHSAQAGIAAHWHPPEAQAHRHTQSQQSTAHVAQLVHQASAQESLPPPRWDQLASPVHNQGGRDRGQEEHDSGSELWVAPLSASSLLQLGVPLQEVAQLVDLQTFLLRNFGLELAVKAAPELRGRRRSSESSGACGTEDCTDTPPRARLEDGGAPVLHTDIERVMVLRRKQYEMLVGEGAAGLQLLFAIPTFCVGAVIGRGGRGLRDLQAQFGVRVYVEKEDYLGQRIVVLTALSAAAAASNMSAAEQTGFRLPAVSEEQQEPQLDLDGRTGARNRPQQQPRGGGRGTISDSIQKETLLDGAGTQQLAASAAQVSQLASAQQHSQKARGREREALGLGDASPLEGRGGGAHKRNRTDEGGGDLPVPAHSAESTTVTATTDIPSAACGGDPSCSEKLPGAVTDGGPSAVQTDPPPEKQGSAQVEVSGGKAAREADMGTKTHNEHTKPKGGEEEAEEVGDDVDVGSKGEDGAGEGASSDGDDNDGDSDDSSASVNTSSSSRGGHGRKDSKRSAACKDGDTRQTVARAKRKRTSQSSASPEHAVVLSSSPHARLAIPEPRICEAQRVAKPSLDPQAALQLCKERIEALVEDALQKKDLQTDDDYRLP